jgi:hypothetical protein
MKEEPKPACRPGDLILDKYMPNATPLEREQARYNLSRHAETLITIGKRLEAEEEARERDTHTSESAP